MSKREKAEILRPNIFQYHDYRGFLKDWFEYLKGEKKISSLSVTKRAGFSVGFMPQVLGSQKHLSHTALSKILPELLLEKNEQAYLELLHELDFTQSQKGKLALLERLQKFPGYQQVNAREIEVFRYMTRWYYIAIKEMADLPGFKADVKWIRSKLFFKVSSSSIREALDFLFENKFLSHEKDGKVKVLEKNIKCTTPVYGIVLKDYHRQNFQLAQESMELIPRDERYLHGFSFPIEDFEEVQKILEGTVEKLRQINQRAGNKKAICHVELAAFPFTKKD